MTGTGTFEGKTAQQWRDEAAQHSKTRQESWDRSDTDGCVSQWASGLSSSLCLLKAELAEGGAVTEVMGLFDLEGNLVPARHGWSDLGMGRSSEYWLILDADERGCKRFFNPSQARNEDVARRNNAVKGFYEGRVRVPAKAEIVGGGKGLGGMASCRAAIVPANRDITADNVIEIVDNGKG